MTFKDDGFKTCKKEVKEELGITLEDEDIEYIDTLVYFEHVFIEIYYSNKIINEKDIVLQKEEVESVSWLSLDEINNLIKINKFRPGNIKPLELVIKHNKNIKQI